MRYIGKKLITMLVTVLIVTLLVFFAFKVIPGDPAVPGNGDGPCPAHVRGTS